MNATPHKHRPYCIGLVIACLAAVLCFASSYSPKSDRAIAAQETMKRKEAEKEIRKVLDDQVAAWNKGDLKAFMAGYWQSPELSFFSGKDKTHGWQGTLERYQKRYQAEGKEMGKLNFSELEIEVVAADCAWVRGRWQLVARKETLGGLFTLIFKKLPEGWRIVHDHTSAG